MYGRLGNGSTSDQTSPTLVSMPPGTSVVAVAPGIQHTLGLTEDGDVYAWGLRSNGALGDGSTSGYVSTPQQVSGLTNMVAIAAGYRSSYAVEDDGSVRTVNGWRRCTITGTR